MDKVRILMVEDELDVLRINERIMRRRGYEVMMAATCQEAYALLNQYTFDLLILDIMLPDGNGLDLCNYFRKDNDQPVIFLTGKNEVSDKINGLTMGCDYYLTKPYDLDELLAVTNRLITKHLKQKELTIIQKGSLVIDIMKAKVMIDGKEADLTSKEFALLLLLVQNEDKEISPQKLYEAIWGVPSMDDIRTIRTHIKNLRRKINAETSLDYDIISAYGKGYTFTMIR